MTVSGSGFDANEGATSVWICDKPCDIMNVTLNGIQCFTAEMSGLSLLYNLMLQKDSLNKTTISQILE